MRKEAFVRLLLVALSSVILATLPTQAQVDVDAVTGYGNSLYFPFGGETGAGFRDYFQNGDFTSLTLDYWVKLYGGSSLQHMARACHFTFITKDDTNYLQLFANEYKTLEDASVTGTVSDYNTMGVSYFHRMGGPDKFLPSNSPTEWARWTVTLDSTSLKLYINGSKIYDQQYTKDDADGNKIPDPKPLTLDKDSEAYFTLGQYTFKPGQTIKTTNFYGQIDELYMYDEVVSESEITANWKKMKITSSTKAPIVYHSFDESTRSIDGTGRHVLANGGSGGIAYDLILGETVNGATFTDSNTEASFTGVKPSLVVSTVPFEDVRAWNANGGNTPHLFRAIVAPVGKTSSQALSGRSKIVFPESVEITFLPTGALTDAAGSNIPTNVAITEAYYKPSSTSQTTDQFSYKIGGAGTNWDMPIQIANEPTLSKITTTPIEDKLFSMNIGCVSNVGFKCSVEIIKDVENCLYQTKFMSIEAAAFNMDQKYTIPAGGAVLVNPPGYVICQLSQDRQGNIADAAKFRLSDPFTLQSEVNADYQIQSIDDLPTSLDQTVAMKEDDSAKKITLGVSDPESSQLAVVITKLPTKGKLYFEKADGSMGAEITKPFTPWSAKESSSQFAFNVTGVSSFWGNGVSISYHPIQVLGPPSVDSFGDSIYAWSPLWKDGQGSYTEGGDSIISFKHDPMQYFADNGAYEFLEVNFTNSVFITGIEIGENRGMGSITEVKAWYEAAAPQSGNWYTLWQGEASNSIQNHHAKFQSYRKFGPTVCNPPFKSNKVRIEMDTFAVPDWNEIDYVKLFGSVELPDGALEHPSRSVYYKPDADAYGVDTFEYSAYDCPYDRYRNSEVATISVNIEQVNDPPELGISTVTTAEGQVAAFNSLGVVKNHDGDEIDLKITKASESLTLFDGSSRIQSYPYTVKLDNLRVNITNCLEGVLEFTMKDALTAESELQTVAMTPNCLSRPPACSMIYWNFVASDCDDSNKRGGAYSWKNPRPENPLLPSDCCIKGQNFGDFGSPCVAGSALPSNFTFDCEYIVADSPVSIAMIAVNVIIILLLCLVILIFIMKGNDRSIKRSQPIFIIIACFGGLVGLLSPFWMIGKPNASTCTMTTLTVFFGIAVMYSAFLTKMMRIDMIFNNQSMSKVVLPTNAMLQLFGKICGLVTLMLIIHMAVAPPKAMTEFRTVNGESIPRHVCKDNTGDITFLLAVFVHAILMIYSAYVAYKIKDVQDDFQESKSMFLGLYNTTFVCIAILPIVLALDLDITVRFILVTIGTAIAFGGTCIAITGAKAFSVTAGSVAPSINNTANDILNSKMGQRSSSVFEQKKKTSKINTITPPITESEPAKEP